MDGKGKDTWAVGKGRQCASMKGGDLHICQASPRRSNEQTPYNCEGTWQMSQASGQSSFNACQMSAPSLNVITRTHLACSLALAPTEHSHAR